MQPSINQTRKTTLKKMEDVLKQKQKMEDDLKEIKEIEDDLKKK
jgi:hypothetical protein